jgi:hypothetical protein
MKTAPVRDLHTDARPLTPTEQAYFGPKIAHANQERADLLKQKVQEGYKFHESTSAWDKEVKGQLWKKADTIPGTDPSKFRADIHGEVIEKKMFGNPGGSPHDTTKKTGWARGHIIVRVTDSPLCVSAARTSRPCMSCLSACCPVRVQPAESNGPAKEWNAHAEQYSTNSAKHNNDMDPKYLKGERCDCACTRVAGR